METYLTVEELAAYLKIATQTIRRWVQKHKIPFCKINNSVRFRLSEIESWVDNSGVLSALVKTKDGASSTEGGDLLSGTDSAGEL